jgi:hypothetical protein
MRRLLTIALLIATPAYAADDPAVLVCEEIIRARIKTPKSYERVAAEIRGSEVRVIYDAVNLYNAPIRSNHTCAFQLGRDGHFTLASSRLADVNREIEMIRRELADTAAAGRRLSEEEHARIAERIAEVESQTTLATMEGIADIAVASELDEFPIDPAQTQLTLD